MDQRLFNAACAGDIDTLHQLLQENPFVLGSYALSTMYENPLNIATKAGQLHFVQEIIKLKPELAREISQDGFRPLDIASANGCFEIVKALLAAVDPNICRLPGRDGRTAIHYAAINGKIEIINELLASCSDSVKDVTTFGETVLHLAVKYFQFEAFECLVQWIGSIDMRGLVNWKDKDGNTILHCAVSRKQLQIVELILHKNNSISDVVEVNAVNTKGLTAIDIMDILFESSSDVHLRKMLQNAGCQGAPAIRLMAETQSNEVVDTGKQSQYAQTSDKKPKTWMDSFRFQKERDSPSEARNALLVVAALIVAVTFEAGINPPSYIIESSTCRNSTLTDEQQAKSYGINVPLTVFLVANSIALCSAYNLIDYLREGLPFQRELRISGFFMLFAYVWSLDTKDISLVVALLLLLFIRWLPVLVKNIWKHRGVSSDQHKQGPLDVLS